MVFTTNQFTEVEIESWPDWDGTWTHNHWIPFRRSNQLSCQAMSSSCSQRQLCTATPIMKCTEM